MKGVIESIPAYLYIVVAFAVGILMVALLYKYSGLFFEKKNIVEGNRNQVAEILAQLSMRCWDEHGRGTDPNSDVCETLDLNPSEIVTERDVTGFLECEILPNSDCSPNDCSFCVSPFYDDTNKLDVIINTIMTQIKISYYGHLRKIIISEV